MVLKTLPPAGLTLDQAPFDPRSETPVLLAASGSTGYLLNPEKLQLTTQDAVWNWNVLTRQWEISTPDTCAPPGGGFQICIDGDDKTYHVNPNMVWI